MKVNHPSAHILRAKRCRDSLARSPLASAATRDGAATRRRGTMRTREKRATATRDDASALHARPWGTYAIGTS